MYRLMGRTHAGLHRAYQYLAAERGQGTVEYVALVLLIAGVFAAVVAAGDGGAGKQIATKIVGEIKQQIDSVGAGKH
jgi:hypothetical protein